MREEGAEPDTLSLRALRAVAAAVVAAPSAEQVACQALAALTESGVASAAALLVRGMRPVRHIAGSPDVLARYGGLLDALADGAPCCQPHADTSVCSVPTMHAPASVVCLLGLADGSGAVGACVATILATALDRCYLQARTEQLGTEAERRFHEVETIHEISSLADKAEPERLLALITEKAARAMSAQACSLMRLDPETQTLTIAAAHGLSEDVVHVAERALGEGIAGGVAMTGEPLLISEAADDPRLSQLSLRPDIGSAMVVPMRDGAGSITGVMSIRRRRPGPEFDEEDLRLFSVIASQAALVISNNQLTTDLRRRVHQLQTLYDLTQVVISTLDVEGLLRSAASNIVDVVKFDRCCIYLLDRHTRRYVPRAVRGYRPEVVGAAPVRYGDGVIGLVAKKQMPIVEMDARNAIQPLRGFGRALGTSSFVVMPIVAKGQTIGVVLADNKRTRRAITEESIDLLSTFANQVGLAVENAQLYEDRELRFQEMHRLATQTDNIVRSIAASVVVLDTAGCVTRWNKGSEEMWGIAERDAIGRPFGELLRAAGLPVGEAAALEALRAQVMSSGRPHQAYRQRLHSRNGAEMSVNLLVSPVTNRVGERLGIVQIMEDATRETRMESEMARIRRLADIGQLAAKMAHEVRNPLSSIKGAAQLMRQEAGDNPAVQEFIGIIIDEVNALSGLTTDLLDFARPMRLDVRATDLRDLIRSTCGLMQNGLSGSGVDFELRVSDGLPEVLVDPKQIQQILRNLLLNAVQAMPDGGVVTIGADYDAKHGSVAIDVTDRGVGIPEDRLPHIFQPLYTTKTKGTGLGLSIVNKIVENHGGTIQVSSRPQLGSTFTVRLPIEARPPAFVPLGLPEESSRLGSALPDA